MFNYDTAKEKIKEGLHITRHGWDLCKIIRKAIESDYDYINFDVDGQIVEDCENRQCDCKIRLFRPTPEDIAATDYVIAV